MGKQRKQNCIAPEREVGVDNPCLFVDRDRKDSFVVVMSPCDALRISSYLRKDGKFNRKRNLTVFLHLRGGKYELAGNTTTSKIVRRSVVEIDGIYYHSPELVSYELYEYKVKSSDDDQAVIIIGDKDFILERIRIRTT